jgi:hypothetical protein
VIQWSGGEAMRTVTWTGPVNGTPRWALTCAWATPISVIPSGLWRTMVGFGVPLGWTPAHLRLEQIPGFGTVYVLVLTLVSTAAAALTLGLVYPWGERLPGWVPLVSGRRVPVRLPIILAVSGAAIVTYLIVLSIINWSHVSGFADNPRSGWATLMVACYLPAALWPPLLLAVTYSYARRRLAAVAVPEDPSLADRDKDRPV